MLKSMTGYGYASFEDNNLRIEVEIKTLNSKFLDISFKLPKEILQYENTIKNLLTSYLVRGKVLFSMEIIPKASTTTAVVINKPLYELYKLQLLEVCSSQLSDATILPLILNMPHILIPQKNDGIQIKQRQLLKVVENALTECDKFRRQEGLAATKALTVSAHSIAGKLLVIQTLDLKRIASIKKRINANLSEFISPEKVDKNRFEQELIYYIEKIDITEEVIRLKNHLTYFEETLTLADSHGKKIGFISQEMGREINTIGSKANNSELQHLVVDMKDELEQIKEQVLNVV